MQGLLPALAQQASAAQRLAIDSSSSDGTRALLTAAGFQVQVIEQREFGHGRTRNALVAWASSEFVVFFSQDAQPQGPDFCERLLAPLRQDPQLVAVCARVLPRADDDPLTARSVLAAPEASAQSLVGERAASAFHNVAAAYRRAALLQHPFADVPFGEDQAWAQAAHARGDKVRLEAQAIVQHSHRYTLRQAYQRYRIDAAFHLSQRGVRLRPNCAALLRGYAYELREDWRYRPRSWSALARALLLRGAQVLGQYHGSRPQP